MELDFIRARDAQWLELVQKAGVQASFLGTDLKAQRDSIRDALIKLLDANRREVRAASSYQNALENFSGSDFEKKDYERAMLASMKATQEARMLLSTLTTQ
ncbi:MAG: hypothetical protein ACRCV9_03045 [Burkholderiaceae bacterium]